MGVIDEMQWKTLTEMMASRAEYNPDWPFAHFLKRGEIVGSYTYLQTWEWANRWAALLVERGVRSGEVVILALPNTDDFIGAYFGALLAGGVPAPAAPFRCVRASDPYLAIIAGRLRFVESRVLIVPEEQADIGDVAPLSEIENLVVLTRRDLPLDPEPISPGGDAHDLALLQFTSGTSGMAKAVQLTHTAVLTQTRAIAEVLQVVPHEDRAVSWLPLFHDMGLIGYLLTPAFTAACVYILRVEDFMLRPSLWIKALSDFRATITGGPPSAYALCARRVKASELAQYDLHSVRIALAGAEMVAPESLQRFADEFRPAGFRESSLMPTYGMAENGLAVSMPPLDRGADFDIIDLEVMQDHGLARSVNGAAPTCVTRAFASVGVPLPQTEVAIVDAAGERLGERHIGEIIVRSPSLMKGYYKQPQATRQALRDGWLWTGDMGYIADGKLHMTGRKKEVLIVGGRNYYPDDIEQAASAVPGVRLKRTVAFSYDDPERATEAVVVLAETALKELAARDTLRQNIRKTVIRAGYPISEVVLLPPRTIETTINGKLKRAACKQRYLAGDFVDGR